MKKTKEITRRILAVSGILLIVILLFLILDKKTTFADSGFDFSYDSGGSSYSDYGSSYDYGSDYDYDSDYDSSGGNGIAVKTVVLLGFCYLGVIIFKIMQSTSNRNYRNKMNYNQYEKQIDDSVVEEKIKKYIPDFYKTEFLKDGYKIYCDIQNAWMNFELEKVRDVITDELYSMYATQLETLKVKGNQNIMSNFELKKCYLKDVIVENKTITITAGYVIELYDYIVDIASGEIVRGRKNNKARVDYEMKFRRTLNESEKVNKCPNCGAELNINSAGYCNYCNSKIVTENTKWVLTEKKVLGQIYM